MIALALAPGRMRLADLRRHLPGVSTGVLERYVQQMVGLELVTRTRFKEMPPRVELELTDAGRELLPIAQALARWGMRHVWSPPRGRERVDIDSLLRLLPDLLAEQTGLPDGCVEAVVADAEPPVRRRYRVQGGRLRMDDRAGDAAVNRSDATAGPQGTVAGLDDALPTASIRGDGEAWIAALVSAGDYGRLEIAGDERLARRILDALPRSR